MIRRISGLSLILTMSISSAIAAPPAARTGGVEPRDSTDSGIYTSDSTHTSERNGWAGVLLGAAVPTLDGLGGRFAYGGGAGYRITPNFGLGASFTTSSETISGVSVRIGLLAAEGRFFFPEAPGFTLGVRAGPAFQTGSLSVAGVKLTSSETDFFAGALAGYDVMLADQFSIGVEVDWDHLFADPKSYEVFSFLVPLRVWF